MMLSLAITMLPLVITRQAACDNDDGEPASDINAAACDNVAAACENDDGEAACDEDVAAYDNDAATRVTDSDEENAGQGGTIAAK